MPADIVNIEMASPPLRKSPKPLLRPKERELTRRDLFKRAGLTTLAVIASGGSVGTATMLAVKEASSNAEQETGQAIIDRIRKEQPELLKINQHDGYSPVKEIQRGDRQWFPDRPPQTIGEYLTETEGLQRLASGLKDIYYQGGLTFKSAVGELLDYQVEAEAKKAAKEIIAGLKQKKDLDRSTKLSRLNPVKRVDGAIVNNACAASILLDFQGQSLNIIRVPVRESKKNPKGVTYEYDPQLNAAIQRQAVRDFEIVYRVLKNNPPKKSIRSLKDIPSNLYINREELDIWMAENDMFSNLRLEFLTVALDLHQKGQINLNLFPRAQLIPLNLIKAIEQSPKPEPSRWPDILHWPVPFLGGFVAARRPPTTTTGGMTRRDFIKLGSIAGAAAAVAKTTEIGYNFLHPSQIGIDIISRFDPEVWNKVKEKIPLLMERPLLAREGGIIQVKDRQGNIIGEKFYDVRCKKRLFTSWEDIRQSDDQERQYLVNALISTEDNGFFSNEGADYQGLLRIIKEQMQSGGSTITQQLIKNLCFTTETPQQRKPAEILLAFFLQEQLEQEYLMQGNIGDYKRKAKETILASYLNLVQFGTDDEGTAIYGVETAAQSFFGKKTRDLTAAESTLIAGLPNSPAKFNPFGHKEYHLVDKKTGFIGLADKHPARIRQKAVLDLMVKHERMTKAKADAIWQEGIVLTPPHITTTKAPEFFKYIIDNNLTHYLNRDLLTEGVEVQTSLDPRLQAKVDELVEKSLPQINKFGANSAAVVIKRADTGEILAYVGDASSDRMPGSTVKPVTYAVAREQGVINNSSVLNNVPFEVTDISGRKWRPANFGGSTNSQVSPGVALAQSLNIPAINTLMQTGVMSFAEGLKRCGLNVDLTHLGWSSTLGTDQTNLLLLTNLYSIIANQGKRKDSFPIRKVMGTDSRGKDLLIYQTSTSNNKGAEQIIDKEVVKAIVADLSDIGNRPSSNWKVLHSSGTFFAKTGSSSTPDEAQGGLDHWTIGGTIINQAGNKIPIVVGVWVGNKDGTTPLIKDSSSLQTAAPLFRAIMDYIID